MNKLFNIFFSFVLIGIVVIAPAANHYCEGVISESLSISEEHVCCSQEKESIPNECCEIEFHFFAEDHDYNAPSTIVELSNVLDFWTENFFSINSFRYDLYQFTKGYLNSTDTPYKNETGLYKYVQSFLI